MVRLPPLTTAASSSTITTPVRASLKKAVPAVSRQTFGENQMDSLSNYGNTFLNDVAALFLSQFFDHTQFVSFQKLCRLFPPLLWWHAYSGCTIVSLPRDVLLRRVCAKNSISASDRSQTENPIKAWAIHTPTLLGTLDHGLLLVHRRR